MIALEEWAHLTDGPCAGRRVLVFNQQGGQPATELWANETTGAGRVARVWFRYVRVGASGVWRWDPNRRGTTLPDSDWFTVNVG